MDFLQGLACRSFSGSSSVGAEVPHDAPGTLRLWVKSWAKCVGKHKNEDALDMVHECVLHSSFFSCLIYSGCWKIFGWVPLRLVLIMHIWVVCDCRVAHNKEVKYSAWGVEQTRAWRAFTGKVFVLADTLDIHHSRHVNGPSAFEQDETKKDTRSTLRRRDVAGHFHQQFGSMYIIYKNRGS